MINPSTHSDARGILFYDGACGLCTRSVRFLLWADRAGKLRFAPLQGETAKKRLPADLRKASCLSTVVYLCGDQPQPLLRSEAVCRAMIDLGGFWRCVGRTLLITPYCIREAGYRFVAKHRMRILSRCACALPTPQERTQMLD